MTSPTDHYDNGASQYNKGSQDEANIDLIIGPSALDEPENYASEAYFAADLVLEPSIVAPRHDLLSRLRTVNLV